MDRDNIPTTHWIIMGIIIVIGISLILAPPIKGLCLSDTLLDQVDTIPAGEYAVYSIPFHESMPITIHVEVVSGGTINFFVMDKEDMLRFSKGEDFFYYDHPSRKDIGEATIDWYSKKGRVYFVIDNTHSTSSKITRLKVVGYLPELQHILGASVILGGFLWGVYEYRRYEKSKLSKPKDRHSNEKEIP